jgi:hypothetical protein
VQAPAKVGIQFALLIRDLFWFGSRLLQGCFGSSRLLQLGLVWFKISSVRFKVASVWFGLVQFKVASV